jgi:hypothetical protein
METNANPTPGAGGRPPWGQIWTTVFVALFIVLLFLLGRSMLDHRFFRGEREHQNGSIGQ